MHELAFLHQKHLTTESVGSVPVIPMSTNPEGVKSAPVLLELVESTVVTPESVKSSLSRVSQVCSSSSRNGQVCSSL